MGYDNSVTWANSDCLWSSQRNEFLKIEILIMQVFKSLEIQTKWHLKIKNEGYAQIF